METYKLRYFFDPGSGICLWSENDVARDRFGYPVDINGLGLTLSLMAQAKELATRFDTSIDWENPSGPSPWSNEKRAQFETDAADFLRALREHVGAAFEIRDCSR
jgi:hypothetical protein